MKTDAGSTQTVDINKKFDIEQKQFQLYAHFFSQLKLTAHSSLRKTLSAESF